MRWPAKLDAAAFVAMAVLGLLLALALYGFWAAWFEPICRDGRELQAGGCLPIGFEGPFADVWSNRSLFNARLMATVDLCLVGALFAAASYFFFVKKVPSARWIAWGLVAAMVLKNLLVSIFLNDLS